MYSGRRYYFLEIAETLNMSRAAEKLRVSQPSLSQYLNKLEKELGVKLIDRNYSPLHLTPAGKVYYQYLTDSKKKDDELEYNLSIIRSNERSPLHIGIPLQKSYELTKVILPKFIEKYPSVYISIWEGTSSTTKTRLAAGELEIGFGHTLEADSEELTVRPLTRERVLIICNSVNPILEGRKTDLSNSYRIKPQLLQDQLFFQMAPEYFLYNVETADLEKYGIRPSNKLIMSNLHSIINAIQESKNSGFAYMPDYVFDNAPESLLRDIAFLRLGEEDIHWNFSLMKNKNGKLSKEGKLFWDCVVDSFSE